MRNAFMYSQPPLGLCNIAHLLSESVEVNVFGFDDSEFAFQVPPKLST